MKCPKCGFVNPVSAMRCECGYELLSEHQETPNSSSSEQDTFNFIDRYFESPDPHRVYSELKLESILRIAFVTAGSLIEKTKPICPGESAETQKIEKWSEPRIYFLQ